MFFDIDIKDIYISALEPAMTKSRGQDDGSQDVLLWAIATEGQ